MKKIIPAAALVILLAACGDPRDDDTIEQVEAKPQNNFTETIICYFGPNVVKYTSERIYRKGRQSYIDEDGTWVLNANGRRIADYSPSVPCVLEREFHD